MKLLRRVLAVGQACGLFLLISYLFCVATGLVYPEMAMYEAWEPMLPGFDWISWPSFFLGAVQSYLWGWYIAIIWVPLYNWTAKRNQLTEG